MISSCHEYDPVEKDAPNDRKQFSSHIARGCSGQLTDLRDDGQGAGAGTYDGDSQPWQYVALPPHDIGTHG